MKADGSRLIPRKHTETLVLSVSQDGANFIYIVKINIVCLSTKASLFSNDVPWREKRFYFFWI